VFTDWFKYGTDEHVQEIAHYYWLHGWTAGLVGGAFLSWAAHWVSGKWTLRHPG